MALVTLSRLKNRVRFGRGADRGQLRQPPVSVPHAIAAHRSARRTHTLPESQQGCVAPGAHTISQTTHEVMVARRPSVEKRPPPMLSVESSDTAAAMDRETRRDTEHMEPKEPMLASVPFAIAIVSPACICIAWVVRRKTGIPLATPRHDRPATTPIWRIPRLIERLATLIRGIIIAITPWHRQTRADGTPQAFIQTLVQRRGRKCCNVHRISRKEIIGDLGYEQHITPQASNIMQHAAGIFQNMGSNFDVGAILKMNQVTPAVQAHLAGVYRQLLLALVVSALGSYLGAALGAVGSAAGMVSIGCLLAMTCCQPRQYTLAKQVLFLAFAFFKGVAIAPLIRMAVQIDPAIVTSALMLTAGVFAIFSALALFSRRREYLYLGSILGSCMWMLLGTSMLAWVFPGMRGLAFNVNLYGGLLIFVGYIVLDTQMIVEKAANRAAEDLDVLGDAAQLFIDLVAVFVRILIILMKNGEKKNNKKNNRG